jgi:hypothetical protein
MARMILELHDWLEEKPDDDDELIVLFLFTLMPAAAREARIKPGPDETFWTEARLARDLSSRGAWPGLSKRDKVKALFRFAQEKIVEAGRKLREAPLYWTPTSPFENGPPWSLDEIRFPKAPAVAFDAREPGESPSLLARKGAGLLK